MATEIPYGETAQRLEWAHLPAGLRAWIERKCGSPVSTAVSQRHGFTPGFASVLTCEDGTRHFVKAASAVAQRPFAEAYRVEAARLAALPEAVAAPRLKWHLDDDWVVLGIEYVEARHPQRPWQAPQLAQVLDALEHLADTLTPAPGAVAPESFADDLGHWPGLWDGIDRPFAREAAALARTHGEHTAGDTVVHTDVRADNVLIDSADAVLFCDWNWPVRGAAWLDSLILLIEARVDGIDVESMVRTRPLLRDVPAEGIDSALALFAGYFFFSAAQPVPRSSPWIRAHQQRAGEATWQWLAERRSWSI